MKTVEYIMERVGSNTPGFAIEYIRDAFMAMGLIMREPSIVKYYDMVTGQSQYPLPSDCNALLSVSIRNTDAKAELLGTADRILSGGTPNWTNSTFTAFDSTNDITCTGTATGQLCYLDTGDTFTIGKRYRLGYDSTIRTGGIELRSYTGNKYYGTFENGTSKFIEFTAKEASKLSIVGITNADSFDLDNFTLKEIGNTEYLRVSRIIGNTKDVPDDNRAPYRTPEA